jgi:hypothetical protein
MSEHPILFSGEMVRAILSGNKTQTRRIIKLRDPSETYSTFDTDENGGWPVSADECGEWHRESCPYGMPGDKLWVRETWRDAGNGKFLYRATPPALMPKSGLVWKPSIFMPRRACRIILAITDIRVERLQDISEEDAAKEGVDAIPSAPAAFTHLTSYAKLWDLINTKRGYDWKSNPYIWVIEFYKL